MKKNSVWCSFLLGTLLISSCNKAVYDQPKAEADTYQASFSGSIKDSPLRASATAWDADDKIGIYALNSGTDLSQTNIYKQISNVAYKTIEGDGNFTAVNPDDKIMFPASGEFKDFIAYYPYTDAISGEYVYSVDVSNQSNPAAIDLLYAKASGSKSATKVNFNFSHQLSRIFITLKRTSDELDLMGATVTLKGAHSDAQFKLADAGISLGTAKADILTKQESAAAELLKVSAILVPGQNMNELQAMISLADGKTYTWTPEDKELLAGNSYGFTLKLTAGEKEAVVEDNTINDWNDEGDIDGGSLDPDESKAIRLNKTNVDFEASAGSSEVEVIVEDDKTWTVSKTSADWLSISPENGTGKATVTLTATENTDVERQATLTFSSEGKNVTLVVTQKAATSSSSTSLWFNGADFEDWTAFEEAIGVKKLQSYATQSSDEAYQGSSSLHIKANASGNDYVFSVKAPASGYKAPTKFISFYIKGTSAKSLSMNVYDNDENYATYNLGDLGDEDVTLEEVGSNQYAGTIDTNGKWVKVTLNISSISSSLQTTGGGDIFAIKIGKKSDYNIYIDNIEAE